MPQFRVTTGSALSTETPLTQLLSELTKKLVSSLQPKNCLSGLDELKDLDSRRPAYIGAFGKASASMAAAVLADLKALGHGGEISGRVLAPSGISGGLDLEDLKLEEVRPPGSNEPTEEAVAASGRVLSDIQVLGADVLRVFLVSGGGSKILLKPAPGFSLEDIIKLNSFLDSAGADISERNSVVSLVDELKLGGLARAASQGEILNLVISDVMSDDLQVISSGPSVPGQASKSKALAVLEKYRFSDEELLSRISNREVSPIEDTFPKGLNSKIVSSNRLAVDGLSSLLKVRGFEILSLKSGLEGDTEALARQFFLELKGLEKRRSNYALIWGGETTVSAIRESSKGGRSQHFALSVLKELAEEGSPEGEILIGSFGTDGEDGPTEFAGAVISNDHFTFQDNQLIRKHLEDRTSHDFFKEVGGHIDFGGLSGTNVGDIMFAICEF